VANSWSRDFDALAERSRHGLRPLEAFSQRPEETKMRFFKTHPALAALFTVLAIGLLSGAAYAVVKEVWITIDPKKPAEQIEQDVRAQLEKQGVKADFHSEKDGDGRLKIKIRTDDPALGSGNIHLNVAGSGNTETHQRTVRVFQTYQGEHNSEGLADIMSAPEMIGVLEDETLSDEEVTTQLHKVLADRGYDDVEIKVEDRNVTITIKSPPKPKQ
jgi:hypothetical protein